MKEINRQNHEHIAKLEEQRRILQDELNSLKVSKQSIERKYLDLQHFCENVNKRDAERDVTFNQNLHIYLFCCLFEATESAMIALRSKLDATEKLLELSDERRKASVEKYTNTVRLIAEQCERTNVIEKANKKLEMQVESLTKKLAAAMQQSRLNKGAQQLLDDFSMNLSFLSVL